MFTASAKGGFFYSMNQLVTITTDFGDGFATSQLEAVVARLGFEGKLIENHDVKPFSIVEGAYGIWQLAKFCPAGTVHVGVVDPGVGSERAGIIVRSEKYWFVGPDNGLLWPALRFTPGEYSAHSRCVGAWRLNEKWFGEVANTFHGRDVFIKAAVKLAQGERPENFGCKPNGEIVKLEFAEGQVVHIDHYGNAKIWGEKTFGLPVVETFSDVPEGDALMLNGSSGLLELAINCGNAAETFGLKLGQVINDLRIKKNLSAD